MCGIAGWAGDAAGGRAELERMCAAVSHRGPDDEGAHLEAGAVALGFRRLSIIDLETGAQPLFSEDRSIVATCNGEIYNFRSLRRELESAGHSFATGSDAEVIVHAYEEDGVGFTDRLQGMFAIALWDASRRRLVLARDRLGVKPLYFCEPAVGQIVYGSEPAALLAHPAVSPRPDAQAVLSFLTLGYMPSPASGLEGVSKLRPGERLVFEQARARRELWWEPPPRTAELTDPRQALAALDEVVRDAATSRLESDVPLGVLLSGGIDSSLVTSYVAEAVPRVKSFSIDFPGTARSEGEAAATVARVCGTEHHELAVDAGLVPAAAEAVGAFSEPVADPSAIPTYLISELTRRHVTVALSGDGGDEAFGGYWRYRRAWRADRLGWAGRLAAPFAGALGPLGPRLEGPAALLRSARLDAHERYAQMVGHIHPARLEQLADPALLEAGGRAARAWEQVLALPAGPSPARYMALDTRTYLPDDVLTKVDRASMAHALEVRSPLLDYRVHELAARISDRLKLRGSATKWVLRELARRRGLPESIAGRSKHGFGMPVGEWLRDGLSEWATDILTDGRLARRGQLRPTEVERMLAAQLAGSADHSRSLWTILMLELWQRRWVDG